MNKKYVVYKNYYFNDGDFWDWDKAYYKEGELNKSDFGCPYKEATQYTEEEAKKVVEYNMEHDDYSTNDGCNWSYELYNPNRWNCSKQEDILILPIWFRRFFWSKKKKNSINFLDSIISKSVGMSQEEFNNREKELGINKKLDEYFITKEVYNGFYDD